MEAQLVYERPREEIQIQTKYGLERRMSDNVSKIMQELPALDDSKVLTRYYQLVYDNKPDFENETRHISQHALSERRTDAIVRERAEFSSQVSGGQLKFVDSRVEKIKPYKNQKFDLGDYLVHAVVKGTEKDLEIFERYAINKSKATLVQANNCESDFQLEEVKEEPSAVKTALEKIANNKEINYIWEDKIPLSIFATAGLMAKSALNIYLGPEYQGHEAAPGMLALGAVVLGYVGIGVKMLKN